MDILSGLTAAVFVSSHGWEVAIWSSVWSPDQKSIYVSGVETEGSRPASTVWKWNLGGSNPEKFTDDCGMVTDADASGQYLLECRIVRRKDWNLRGLHLRQKMHFIASRRSNIRRNFCSRWQIVHVCGCFAW